MTNKNSNVLTTLLIVFIGISSLLLRPENLYSNTNLCSDISSFHSSTITSNSIMYEWTGTTTVWSMNLIVSVNGSTAFSGPVTGNSHVVGLTTPLADGDVVESELIYTDASGLTCSLEERIIVATSQVVLGLQESCSVYCGGVNFCEDNIPEDLPEKVEEYIFKSGDLCDCSAKTGQDRYRCVETLMKGSRSRVVIYCPSFSMFSCPYDLPYTLIVSAGAGSSPPPPPFRLNMHSEPLFSVYPNPFKSNVTVDLSGLELAQEEIIIRDIYGKELHRQFVTQEVLEINLEHLPNGVYWVSLSSNESEMYKLIKVK